MEWRDEGILLATARHGEGGLILDALTADHGRRRGLVRGGASRRRAAEFQVGAQLSLHWRARLEEQLGRFQAEALRARAGMVLDDPLALAAMASAAALLVDLLPESEPQPVLYPRSVALFDALAAGRDWREAYARWELDVLTELGFGLDLSSCEATGAAQELIYVSPRSGRAVSREAGAPYRDKLLPLPGFLQLEGASASADAFADALRLTGFFMDRRVLPALGRAAIPAARARLAALATAHAASDASKQD
ncbi:MAG: DNA repair protein RecO [Pseudomonadota bacterium]